MGVIRDTFNALFKGKIFNTEINQYKLKEQYEEELETRNRTSTAIGSLEDTKADKANPTFTGTATFNGDIVQNGTAYETHAEQVYTKKDTITLRDGAVSALGTGVLTGLVAKKYDGTNDGILGYDKDGFARVGDVGATQKIATIEDSPINVGIPYYDNVSKILKTMDLSPSGTTTTNNIQKILKNENGVKVINGVPVGGQKYFGNSVQTGAIKIKFPNTINTLSSMEIDINDYVATNSETCKLLIEFYAYVTGGLTSSNLRATIIQDGLEVQTIPVSLCKGATEWYLLIGDVNYTWNFLNVTVENIKYWLTGITQDWSTGWEISVVNTLETLDSTKKVTVTPSLNATHFQGKVPTDFLNTPNGRTIELVNKNVDNYKTCGEYYTTACTGTPSNLNGHLKVIAINDGYGVQEFTEGGTQRKFFRSLIEFGWQPWEKILTDTGDQNIYGNLQLKTFGLKVLNTNWATSWITTDIDAKSDFITSIKVSSSGIWNNTNGSEAIADYTLIFGNDSLNPNIQIIESFESNPTFYSLSFQLDSNKKLQVKCNNVANANIKFEVI